MNDSAVRTRLARPDDFVAIVSLLSGCGLPTDDLPAGGINNFAVATAGGKLVGVCGLDVFGAVGLPRSLAVEPRWRRRGVGERLLAENEQRASAAGVRDLYLLTTTARDYLQRLGYENTERASVPAVIAAHPQFRGLCPASAKCLHKVLRPS